MIILPNSTRNKPKTPRLDPREQQRSLFIVTSVAALLVALMMIYWPRDAEPVSAIIERSAPPDSGLRVVFTQNEADDLKSSENLEVAWQDVADEIDGPTDQWLATFVGDLEVEIRAARRGDRSHLVAIYRGNAPEGMRVLNQLVDNFVQTNAPQGSQDALREMASADRAAEKTATAAKRAEDRKNAFFLEQVASDQNPSPQKTESATLSPDILTPRNPSPLWTELSEKLKKLHVQRAEMLARLHPVHPSVKQLDTHINRIQGSLSEISPSYPTTNSLDEQANAPDKPEVINQEHRASQPAPIDEYRRLQKDFRLANEAHEQAVLVAQQAQEEVDRFDSVKLRVASWAERTEPSVFMSLLMALIVSILLGLFVAKGGAILDPTIRTPADAEESLPVPVVGVLPATEVSPSPIKIRPPLWCRSVKLAGQLTVVSFVFCFLLLAILDSGFLMQACMHPLSAFPSAVHRLPELIAG